MNFYYMFIIQGGFMDKSVVLDKILYIINNQLKMISNELGKEDIDKDLFGRKIRFYARDVMTLFCEIEKQFNIKITEELFEKYGFKTIRNITELVECSLGN